MKAEVNYLPYNPRGKADKTLEEERIELLYEVEKKGQQSKRQRENVKHFLRSQRGCSFLQSYCG